MNHNIVFQIHLFSSLYMTGVIWLIQIIHYPLFNFVGLNEWRNYHSKHIQLTNIVIAPPMFMELITLGYLFYLMPDYRSNTLMLFSAFILFSIWLTTFLISVPIHNKLALNYDEAAINKLVQTNWIRTISWTVKSIFLIYLLNISLRH